MISENKSALRSVNVPCDYLWVAFWPSCEKYHKICDLLLGESCCWAMLTLQFLCLLGSACVAGHQCHKYLSIYPQISPCFFYALFLLMPSCWGWEVLAVLLGSVPSIAGARVQHTGTEQTPEQAFRQGCWHLLSISDPSLVLPLLWKAVHLVHSLGVSLMVTCQSFCSGRGRMLALRLPLFCLLHSVWT